MGEVLLICGIFIIIHTIFFFFYLFHVYRKLKLHFKVFKIAFNKILLKVLKEQLKKKES